MAKPTAPLLSFGASGQIGETIVYSKWKGRAYARRYVVPSNPQTTEQTITRDVFSWLSGVYKTAPALFTAAWEAYASGQVMTSRNALVKFNLPVLRGEVDLANFVFSPGALGGLPPSGIVVTPGADLLTVDITAPAVLPTGWTIQAAVACAIADQNPESGLLYTVTAGEDLTSTYQVILSGLDEVLYRVGGFLRWVRPDGKIAYSPAVVGSGTPT